MKNPLNLSSMIRDPAQFIVSEETRKIMADNIKEYEKEIKRLRKIEDAAQNYRTARINSFDKPLHISAIRAKLWDALDEI